VASACVELLERDERTPSIVAADRLARALGTSLAEKFAELEREVDEPDQDQPLTNDLGPGAFSSFLPRGSRLLWG
jgi:transcriptional regulator with XRE-family HTH domain